MNANELKNHLREIIEDRHRPAPPRGPSAWTRPMSPRPRPLMAKLHAEQDHSDAPAKDAASAKDASVIAGVTRPKEETAKTPAPKPVRRSAPKPATPKPATRTATKAPAKAAPKPATRAAAKPATKAAPKPAPAPKAEANGTSTREVNQTVARKLATLAAEAFADESPEIKAKVAYWLHSLPTGSQRRYVLRFLEPLVPREPPASGDGRLARSGLVRPSNSPASPEAGQKVLKPSI